MGLSLVVLVACPLVAGNSILTTLTYTQKDKKDKKDNSAIAIASLMAKRTKPLTLKHIKRYSAGLKVIKDDD